MREFLEILLRQEGYKVVCATDGVDALGKLNDRTEEFDVVITDLKMPRVGGMEVLEHVKRVSPETEVVVMTAYSTTESAIEAMQKGAYDYISKPFKVEEIKVIIQRCIERRRLTEENRRLRGQLREKYSFSKIVGKSDCMRQVFAIIEDVANTRTSILVSGETGTGKEMVAKAIHFNSPRRDKRFLAINCGAIPEQLMESELFGHVKGSFTGAVSNKKGLFLEADGGTLFLDEIGELGIGLQVKLLRALQERCIKPVGSVDEIKVDVRIIAATNRDLEDEVVHGRFRQDLYYRLNVVELPLPALRERRDDIPLLAQFFLERFVEDMGKQIQCIEPEAMEALFNYHYSGNVRELENLIERAVTFEKSSSITLSSLPPHVVERRRVIGSSGEAIEIGEEGVLLEDLLAALEKRYIIKALEMTKGNRTDAAKLLGVSFRSIRYKLAKYGVQDDNTTH
jgi:two-component system response regulator PilR (NtrC family)